MFGPRHLDVMADTIPEVLEEAMFAAAAGLYKMMSDMDDSPPASVVALPRFRVLLTATMHALHHMTDMSLGVIRNDLCIKDHMMAADELMKKGSNRVPKKKGVLKVPKKGVARSAIK